MYLSDLQTGQKGVIAAVRGRGSFRKRILDMGFIKGQTVEVILNAPLEDPIKYKVMDYEVSLRRSEAALIDVVTEENGDHTVARYGTSSEEIHRDFHPDMQTIHVALVGNPNAGKTSLFNVASGAHEHVGNYGGVTVDAKEGRFKHKGYTFKIVDLPGTYSISAYSPEEVFVRRYLLEQSPDIVVNVVAASNLERNLYLTTQLIDMDTYMVIALNMYDEMEDNGNRLDYGMLGKMIGAPMQPTVSTRGKGVVELFDCIIEAYEQREPNMRHIHIHYGKALEESIDRLRNALMHSGIGKHYSKRYLAITLLENNRETERLLRKELADKAEECEKIFRLRDAENKRIEALLNEDSDQAFTNARYGFISGALKETYTENPNRQPGITELIDPIVTSKYFGYPIFLLFMWVMFSGTFLLGAYPQEWIETGVVWLGEWLGRYMADGSLKDLLIDGVIGGVGGVIIFLPNIMILYFFIALMEDSGYLARAAFIMDKVMHHMGLHGKSFIPLIMGFGCGVPAIMATRTIESRNSRMITMLVTPLISCSARLPVYILLVGAFFPNHPGWIMLTLYTTGIVLAVIMSLIFKRYLFHKEDIPFVMELPPYRVPTTLSVFRHTWQKAQQYLRKMGGIILIASIIIWFLGYFPRHTVSEQQFEAVVVQARATGNEEEATVLERKQKAAHQEESYIGRIGKLIEPVLRPIGFDWKISVSLLSGMAAKEVVVSTLGVLYSGDENTRELPEKLKTAVRADGNPSFTPLTAFCLMLFVLIYFPCIATITAIKNESGSWKWGLFAIFYTTALAWVISFAAHSIGSMFAALT